MAVCANSVLGAPLPGSRQPSCRALNKLGSVPPPGLCPLTGFAWNALLPFPGWFVPAFPPPRLNGHSPEALPAPPVCSGPFLQDLFLNIYNTSLTVYLLVASLPAEHTSLYMVSDGLPHKLEPLCPAVFSSLRLYFVVKPCGIVDEL